MKEKTFYLAILILLLFNGSCTEPFEIETQDFESVLVIESTLTDELKKQVVNLSKTSTLENSEVLIENNANVNIVGSNGITYSFSQDTESGAYLSDQEFQAIPEIEYSLSIQTKDGQTYTSAIVKLAPKVELDKVYAERIVDQDKDGVQVLVDTYDPTGRVKYFRYEFEQSYKIIAPNPSALTAEIVNFNLKDYTFEVVTNPREPEIECYSTEKSIGIIQPTTAELSENRIFRFPVTYLDKNNPRLQTRYSILVKQFTQSTEAYTFYNIIKDLGNIGSLLSQGQPGYVSGNISSENDKSEKVLGFFDASSVTSKRIYFNYEDFNLNKPPYFIECNVLVLDYRDNTTFDNDPDERTALYTNLKFYNYQVIRNAGDIIYTIVQPECSVCTSFSSKIKPDFWED